MTPRALDPTAPPSFLRAIGLARPDMRAVPMVSHRLGHQGATKKGTENREEISKGEITTNKQQTKTNKQQIERQQQEQGINKETDRATTTRLVVDKVENNIGGERGMLVEEMTGQDSTEQRLYRHGECMTWVEQEQGELCLNRDMYGVRTRVNTPETPKLNNLATQKYMMQPACGSLGVAGNESATKGAE